MVFFIGYDTHEKDIADYNRRTRRIIETIHVDFDELTAMASEHNQFRTQHFMIYHFGNLVPPPDIHAFVITLQCNLLSGMLAEGYEVFWKNKARVGSPRGYRSTKGQSDLEERSLFASVSRIRALYEFF
ncbi:hypothetical protein Tco_1203500 [Tanacetum coccineum]